MNENNYNSNPKLRLIKSLPYLILVVAPIIYLIIANVMYKDSFALAGKKLLLYILLIVAIVLPTLIPIIEKFQIKNIKNNRTTKKTTIENSFTTLSITQLAIVHSSYIFGWTIYSLTGDKIAMLWFYPIGIIWSFVYWPTQKRYNKFLKKWDLDE